jgi:hypothetical protein
MADEAPGLLTVHKDVSVRIHTNLQEPLPTVPFRNVGPVIASFTMDWEKSLQTEPTINTEVRAYGYRKLARDT